MIVNFTKNMFENPVIADGTSYSDVFHSKASSVLQAYTSLDISDHINGSFIVTLQHSLDGTNFYDLDALAALAADGQVIKLQTAEVVLPYFRFKIVASSVVEVAQVSGVDTVADVAGSLNSTYFTFSSVLLNYYCWLNVDAGGVDPEVAGATGVEVAISEDDDADTVAAAIKLVIDALDDVGCAVSTNELTITNGTAGVATETADVSTGFTVATDTLGSVGGADLKAQLMY